MYNFSQLGLASTLISIAVIGDCSGGQLYTGMVVGMLTMYLWELPDADTLRAAIDDHHNYWHNPHGECQYDIINCDIPPTSDEPRH